MQQIIMSIINMEIIGQPDIYLNPQAPQLCRRLLHLYGIAPGYFVQASPADKQYFHRVFLFYGALQMPAKCPDKMQSPR
ncbi:hypothetical protein D3C86_1447580 [compost metagenome]